MAAERDRFDLSGPFHLTNIDWKNPDHRRSVAASLIQGVYTLQRDREEKREGTQALAHPWWSFFHFQLHRLLIDDADQSIFGAIYEYTPNDSASVCPRFVIAFRGTITKGDAFTRDLELDVHFIKNGLHQTSRFEIAIQAVRYVIATYGTSSKLWLAGHSLGSAIAMLAGKTMAKTGIFLESFLFNPPFISPPIEKIKNKKVKHGIRIASSFITAGFAIALKNNHSRESESFGVLSRWVPSLFLNPTDHFSSEYIGYFEHRKKMEDIGAGEIEKLATRHSFSGLVMKTLGKELEESPLHLIPSANVVVNKTRARYTFKEAHGIHQWWRFDLDLQSRTYQY